MSEKLTKATTVHARIVAPDQVICLFVTCMSLGILKKGFLFQTRAFNYPDLPEYDEETDVLLFPSKVCNDFGFLNDHLRRIAAHRRLCCWKICPMTTLAN